MTTHKNPKTLDREDASERLQQGLALILSALPELIFRWLASRRTRANNQD